MTSRAGWQRCNLSQSSKNHDMKFLSVQYACRMGMRTENPLVAKSIDLHQVPHDMVPDTP